MAENQREKRGRLFRKAVESLGLDSPVTEISERLDYDKGNLSKVLNNKIQPSTTLIKDFQRAYKINIEDFDVPEARNTGSIDEQIAKKVYEILAPILEGYTENIIKAVMNLHLELNEIKIRQEKILASQENSSEDQKEARKVLELIEKKF